MKNTYKDHLFERLQYWTSKLAVLEARLEHNPRDRRLMSDIANATCHIQSVKDSIHRLRCKGKFFVDTPIVVYRCPM